MTLVPGWKIRRELLRISSQVTSIPIHPFEQAWFRFHEHLFPEKYRTHQGLQGTHDKTAIFLVFQPDGIRGSVAETCRHLNAKGFNVELVSNAPLCEAEIAALRPLCRRITERPNHGYDFGGYRHALIRLFNEGDQPSRLLLLNDSIWFPISEDCDLLDRLQAIETDLAGPVYYQHRHERKSHLQSYMVLLSRKALQSRNFQEFWVSYKSSNSRQRTIRNGEMRMTYACRLGGLSVGYLHQAFARPLLGSLPDSVQAKVVDYDACRLKDCQSQRKFPASQNPQDTCLPLESGYILTNHPTVNLLLLRLPILKKDRSRPYQRQRKALMQSGADTLSPAVLSEVASWDLGSRIEPNR